MGPNRPLTARLGRHFAACAVVTSAVAQHAANADVIVWEVNQPVPLTTDGFYMRVDTQQLISTAGSGLPGWDLNPWSATALNFFWNGATGQASAGVRLNTVAGGTTSGSTLSNLPLGFVVGPALVGGTSGASFGSGSPSFTTTNQGKWNFGSINYFGFRFSDGAGQIRYGWGEMQMGATATTRTILRVAWENSGAPIAVGDTGGPPADYNPCATTNPAVSNGNNLPSYRTDTVADLSTCGGTIPAANYYKFTTGDAGSYTFQTCPTSGSATIALLSACDGSASVLGCGASACDGTGSSVTAVLNAATTVYVVVGGSGLGNTVPVVVTAPPIGICVNAANAAYGDNVISSTQGSATSQSVFNNAAQSAQDTIFKPQWFRFTPTATGDFSFKTCLSGDTKLAIGTGCPTPGGVFTTIAYNDDAPTCFISGTSQNSWGSWIDATNNGASGLGAGFPLTQQLVAGQTYYICVGAYSSTDVVNGSLSISGPEGAPCRPDLNNDDVVNGDDLGILLAQWGPCPTACSADFNDDGFVDGNDLGALLAAWGTCP
jgi:hypothetical protein